MAGRKGAKEPEGNGADYLGLSSAKCLPTLSTKKGLEPLTSRQMPRLYQLSYEEDDKSSRIRKSLATRFGYERFG